MGSTRLREVITLQFGHYSNFVGTHIWNIEESVFQYQTELTKSSKVVTEIETGVTFREGLTLKGDETYTPRLLLYDLKGCLSTLKQDGCLYDVDTGAAAATPEKDWSGHVTRQDAPPAKKNDFLEDLVQDDTDVAMETTPPVDKVYNLDDSVSVWSDYLRLHYHPQSVSLIQEYEHESDTTPFDVYQYGECLKNDFEDKLHFFSEECDNLQGFQILVDSHSSFGGLGSTALDYIHDEFPSKGVITFGVAPSTPNRDITPYCHRLINTALCTDHMSTYSSLFVPLSVNSNVWSMKPYRPVSSKYLTFDPQLDYHSSSLLAIAIETLSSSYRLLTGGVNIRDLTDGLAVLGRKVASLSTLTPMVRDKFDTLPSLLKSGLSSDSLTELTPYMTSVKREDAYMRHLVFTGIPNPTRSRENTDVSELSNLLMENFSGFDPESCFGFTINSSLKITAPFPNIFSKRVTSDGGVLSESTPTPDNPKPVSSIAVATSLATTPNLFHTVSGLYKQAKRMNLAKFARYQEAGLELDDYKETLEHLDKLSRAYTVDMEEML